MDNQNSWVGGWTHAPTFNLTHVHGVLIYSSRDMGSWVHSGEVTLKKGSDISKKQFRGNSLKDVLEQVFAFLDVQAPNAETPTITHTK